MLTFDWNAVKGRRFPMVDVDIWSEQFVIKYHFGWTLKLEKQNT